MHDFTVWVSYGKWRKNGDIRYCLLHLIHLSSTRLRRCGRILSGICEPYCLITPDLTMRYCPILILIDYTFHADNLGLCCLPYPIKSICVIYRFISNITPAFYQQTLRPFWMRSFCTVWQVSFCTPFPAHFLSISKPRSSEI